MSAATEAKAHGALLVVGTLLKHAGPFMMPRFREACDAAIALREHRSRAIRKAVTELLPRLAQYCPDSFSRSYLTITTQHLLKLARQRSSASELRDASYEAIGQLALAVKHHLIPALPELAQVICEHGLNTSATQPTPLPSPRAYARPVHFDLMSTSGFRGVGYRGFGGALPLGNKVRSQHQPTQKISQPGLSNVEDRRRRAVVIDCVANVVEALRDEMDQQHVDAFLDALFASGLSEPLIRTLNVVSKSLPSRRPLVRARLLDELTAVLAHNTPYAPPGWSRPIPRRRPATSGSSEIVPQQHALQHQSAHPGTGATAPKVIHRRVSVLNGLQQQSATDLARAGMQSRIDRTRNVPVVNYMLDLEVVHVPPEREEIVLLSLRALSEFSMEGVCLLPLVRDCVSCYLDCSTSAHIRAAAVATCARLLLPPKHIDLDAVALREAAGTSHSVDRTTLLSFKSPSYSILGITERRCSAASSGHLGLEPQQSRHPLAGSGPGKKGSRLTFVEEDTNHEYQEHSDDNDDDYEDDEDVEEEESTAETDSSSAATSTDTAHIITGHRPLQENLGDENEEENRIRSANLSQPSDDYTALHAAHRKRPGRSFKRRAAATDASSTRTEDSAESNPLLSHQRSTSCVLADDNSRGEGSGNTPRRQHCWRAKFPGLLDDSFQNHVEDMLPPWYYIGPSSTVVDNVLRKLLRVALADEDPTPRAAVLKALRGDDRFDTHLCRAHHVEAISLLLHDEDIELQLATIALLGRLAAHNPAAVLNRIRDALARALAALRCDASDTSVRQHDEQHTSLIGTLFVGEGTCCEAGCGSPSCRESKGTTLRLVRTNQT